MAIATGQINLQNIKESIQVTLSNEASVFAGSISTTLAGSVICDIKAFVGQAASVATVGTITGIPSGMTAPITSNNSTSPRVTINVDTTMATPSGVLTLPITVTTPSGGVLINKTFSYSVAYKGTTGATGPASYSITLSNDTVNIPTDADGTNPVLTGALTVVQLYEGTTSRTPVIGTLAVSGCTANAVGTVVTIASVTADTGYVDIPVSYNAVSIGTKRFSFIKARKGQATPRLTLELPDGNSFKGNIGNPKALNVKLMMGETNVTTSCTTQWYFNGIENAGLVNLKSLSVYPADVTGNLTIKVVATYNAITYQDSTTFFDLDDVYQVSISGKDKIKNSSENVILTAIVFRGSAQIFDGFRCRWTNIGVIPAVVLYEGINTTGTLVERGVEFTLTPTQINDKLDILCELSVDTVEQQLETTETVYVPNYDSRAYSAAMSVALS